MPDDMANQDTQPNMPTKEDFTQPVAVQKENVPQSLPLPAWILEWAAKESQPEPSRDVLLAELEESEPFVAPTLDENVTWGSEAKVLNPLADLETHLQNKDFQAVLSLVEENKDDPTFRAEAGKTLRKHLNLDDLADPLWQANDLLNN